MPLHKSGRAHRLDPTMISAPLGDFRHTMHIGRGGDAFGDTSFLSSHGPSNPESVKSNSESFKYNSEPFQSNSEPFQSNSESFRSNSESFRSNSESFKSNSESFRPYSGATIPSPMRTNFSSTEARLSSDRDDSIVSDEPLPKLQHSESVSSFDLDLDLGPSILGDVLGVMDGLGLGSDWTAGKQGEEDVFNSNGKSSAGGETSPVGSANELNEVNGIKSKGLRPKVRFSDKKEEIIGRQYGISSASEVEFKKEREMSPVGDVQMRPENMVNKEMVYKDVPESSNHRADHSPSPSSSVSSEYEGVSSLDRRREDESASEEECVSGEQGYTFEDESDDEIGL